MEKLPHKTYYTHSNKITFLSQVYMLLFGMAAALVFSVIYTYLVYFIPFVYINFFLTIGLGIGVGISVGFGATFGKLRNVKISVVYGIIAGIFALYIAWVSWTYIMTEYSILTFNPMMILTIMKLTGILGAWSLFKSSFVVKGSLLYLIWIIEALMIVGITTFASLGIFGKVFCEYCNKWVNEKQIISNLELVKNPSELKMQLENSNFAELKHLKTVNSNVYTELELKHCLGCEKNFYLTVKLVGITKDSKGEEEKKEKEIVENLIIDSATYNALKRLGAKV